MSHAQDSTHSALIRLLELVAFCCKEITRDGSVNKWITMTTYVFRMASLFGRERWIEIEIDLFVACLIHETRLLRLGP